MKTFCSLFGLLALLIVGCTAAPKPRVLSPSIQIALLTAQAELSAANLVATPFVQSAIEKERVRNEVMVRALAEVKCPTCRIDLVNGKLVVLDPLPIVLPQIKK